MRHINNYKKFRDEQVNEEFLGSLLAAAKGAFKSFLTGIAAPFKNIKDDFKKGLKVEELKAKVTAMLDTLLKTTTDSINKAEDENALNSIMDQFTKEFDSKCVEIDKEIQAVKESKGNLIIEGAVKDGMIAGRVMLGMVKQKAAELKMEFDKRVAAAKDLAGKKAARIAEIKAIVDDFKKKKEDGAYFDAQITKYKTDNKIKSDVVDYKVGDEVIYLLKDKTPEMYDKAKKPEDQKAIVGVHKIAKIDGDNFTLEDEKGQPTIKKIGKDIMGKVEGGGEAQGGNIVLDWGDVEIEFKAADQAKHPGYSQIVKSGSKQLVVTDGQELLGKPVGEIKKGSKVKFTELLRNGQPDPMKEYETGVLQRIVDPEGKEVDEIEGAIPNQKAEGQDDLVKKLGDMKAKSPDDIKKVSSYVDFIGKPENAPKVAEIEKIITQGGAQ